MEKVIQIFNSHEEAEQADIAFYKSLTGEQRLQILFTLVAQYSSWSRGAAKGFERVCRVIERDER